MPRYKLIQGIHIVPDKSQPKDERTGRHPPKQLKIGDVIDSDEDLISKHGPGHFELVSGERVSSDLSRQIATLQRENHLLRGELSWYQAESGRLRNLLEQHVGSDKAVKQALAETGKPPPHTPEAGLKTPAPAAVKPLGAAVAEAEPEGYPNPSHDHSSHSHSPGPAEPAPKEEQAAPEEEHTAPPPEQQIRQMSQRELRKLASDHGIDLSGCASNRQMADRIVENLFHSED